MAMHKYHKKERGFNRLRPVASTPEEETSKERMLREVQEEAARRKARVIPDQPSEPSPQPKPTPKPKDPYEGLEPNEIEEMKRRERFKKALGSK